MRFTQVHLVIGHAFLRFALIHFVNDSAFLLFSLVLFQIISFFFSTFSSMFCGRLVFSLIYFILFFNISLTIFSISLVWERFVLCPFFTRIFLICINPFWKLFRLFSFFLSLSYNKCFFLLICLISFCILFYCVFGIFIL